MDRHMGKHENPINPGFDFVLRTGKKQGSWYTSGMEYGVDIDDGRIVKIEETGMWMV